MALIPPQRFRVELLRLQMARARRNYLDILAALLVAEEAMRRRQRRRRRYWVKPWIQRRVLQGQYENLMAELMRESRGDFQAFLRMEPAMFHELLQRVTPHIQKDRRRRAPLEPGLKLAITLRYLATGDSYHSLAFDFRVPHNTISLFVPEVCRAITAELQDEVFKTPDDPASWRAVAERFQRRWNFPHCCGAIDGKHIAIRKPPNTGSLYYNYKGFFSIVLLAVVDGDYKFLWADIGANGSSSDCGIYNESALEPALRLNTIGFPAPDPLPHDDRDTPYFLVGDDAFPLRTYMMKPFSHRGLSRAERIFNYRTSRARRVSENAFGILAMRWRCLLTTMSHHTETSKQITKACLCLHNLMRERYPNLQNQDLDGMDGAGNLVPGAWRTAAVMREVDQVGRAPRANREGKQQRLYLKNYFMSAAGRVPWQDHAIDV